MFFEKSGIKFFARHRELCILFANHVLFAFIIFSKYEYLLKPHARQKFTLRPHKWLHFQQTYFILS